MTTYLGKWKLPGLSENDATQALLGIAIQGNSNEYPPVMVYRNDTMADFDVMAWFESKERAQFGVKQIDRTLCAREFARAGGDHVLDGLGIGDDVANDHPGVEWVCSTEDNDDPDPVRRITGYGMLRIWACPSVDGSTTVLFTCRADERILLAEFTSTEMANHFISFVDRYHDFPWDN